MSQKNQRVTIKDVALEANVSPATVSRVLREYDNVTEETYDKVNDAIRKLNYIPNIAASALGSGSLKNIGIVVTRSADEAFDNPFFSKMIMGIGGVLEKNGYGIQLIMTNDIVEEKKRVITALAGRFIQGVILLYSRKYDMLIQDLANHSYPFVVSGRVSDIESDHPLYSVNTDGKTGGYEMTNHLIQLGHKRIAILNGPLEYIVNLDRNNGYRKALVMSGIRYDSTLEMNGGYTYKDAKKAVKETINRDHGITAIFAKDDMKAIAAVEAINEMGLKVPEDISVVGFNNYDISRISSPKITTMNVPIYELGTSSAQMLVDLIENRPIQNNTLILNTEMILRESTCSPKASTFE